MTHYPATITLVAAIHTLLIAPMAHAFTFFFAFFVYAYDAIERLLKD